MEDFTASLITWLLHHPLQRDSDLALAFQAHPTTIYRHLTRLVEEGLVEYLSPSGETNRQRLYYLTQTGLLAAAQQQAASPTALARMWSADEAGLLRLLPRLTILITIQNVINGLVAHAPGILAYSNGVRASLSWHWRRDWQHCFVSKGRKARCRADAVLLFHRSPPLGSAGPGEYYPLLLLADGGLNGTNDRLIVGQRLEQLLRYRESEERIAQYGQFPPIVIVVRDQHQQEHWQHTMQEISQSLRLDPLSGAIICVSPDQAITSSWTLPWQQLESQAPCRLQDQLVPTSLDALPLELFAPIADKTGAERKGRLILGHFSQRAGQLKQGERNHHSRAALLGIQLSHRQIALLTLLYAAPLLSADEVAAFWDVTPPTAARALYELQQVGCIEPQGREGGRRWRLSSSGLRLVAACLQVSLQHIAESTGEKVIQRGLIALLRTIQHTAGIYHFLAQLHRSAREEGHQVAWWETGGWCERRYHDHGTWHNLRPDAALEYVAGTRHIRTWLEWDEGTMTGGALAAKMHTYTYYARSREWARDMRPLPLLLIVAPEPGQEMRIRHLARPCREAGLLVQTTTVGRLTEYGPLAPIWLPGGPEGADMPRRIWYDINHASAHRLPLASSENSGR
jgi:DNA-binding MarR family transcriptional regulator